MVTVFVWDDSWVAAERIAGVSSAGAVPAVRPALLLSRSCPPVSHRSPAGSGWLPVLPGLCTAAGWAVHSHVSLRQPEGAAVRLQRQLPWRPWRVCQWVCSRSACICTVRVCVRLNKTERWRSFDTRETCRLLIFSVGPAEQNDLPGYKKKLPEIPQLWFYRLLQSHFLCFLDVNNCKRNTEFDKHDIYISFCAMQVQLDF